MPEIKEVKKDLEKAKDIIILGESEGGKVLIAKTKSELTTAISELRRYQVCSHAELIAISCKVVERLDILKFFTNAKNDEEVLSSILEEEKAPE